MLLETYERLNRDIDTQSEQFSQNRQRLGRLLNDIDKIDIDERILQSAVITHLQMTHGPHSREYKEKSETVFHAWNAAVQRSLSPDGSSLFQINKYAVPIGRYLDQPTDELVSVGRGKPVTRHGFQNIPYSFFYFNPGKLTWDDISVLLMENSVGKSAVRFQEALSGSSNDLQDAALTHTENLNAAYRELSRDRQASYPSLPPTIIMWFFGKSAVRLFTFGAEPLGANPLLTSDINEILDAEIRKVLLTLEDHIIWNTLSSSGLKMRQTQPLDAPPSISADTN